MSPHMPKHRYRDVYEECREKERATESLKDKQMADSYLSTKGAAKRKNSQVRQIAQKSYIVRLIGDIETLLAGIYKSKGAKDGNMPLFKQQASELFREGDIVLRAMNIEPEAFQCLRHGQHKEADCNCYLKTVTDKDLTSKLSTLRRKLLEANKMIVVPHLPREKSPVFDPKRSREGSSKLRKQPNLAYTYSQNRKSTGGNSFIPEGHLFKENNPKFQYEQRPRLHPIESNKEIMTVKPRENEPDLEYSNEPRRRAPLTDKEVNRQMHFLNQVERKLEAFSKVSIQPEVHSRREQSREHRQAGISQRDKPQHQIKKRITVNPETIVQQEESTHAQRHQLVQKSDGESDNQAALRIFSRQLSLNHSRDSLLRIIEDFKSKYSVEEADVEFVEGIDNVEDLLLNQSSPKISDLLKYLSHITNVRLDPSKRLPRKQEKRRGSFAEESKKTSSKREFSSEATPKPKLSSKVNADYTPEPINKSDQDHSPGSGNEQADDSGVSRRSVQEFPSNVRRANRKSNRNLSNDSNSRDGNQSSRSNFRVDDLRNSFNQSNLDDKGDSLDKESILRAIQDCSKIVQPEVMKTPTKDKPGKYFGSKPQEASVPADSRSLATVHNTITLPLDAEVAACTVKLIEDRYLVVGTRNGILLFYDIKRGFEAVCAYEAHSGPICTLELAYIKHEPADEVPQLFLLTAADCRDPAISVWNCETLELNKKLRGHDGMVTASKDLMNDYNIATSSVDGRVSFWNLSEGGGFIYSVECSSSAVLCLDYYEESATLFSGSQDGLVSIWKLSFITKSSITAVLKTHIDTRRPVLDICRWSPDYDQFIVLSGDWRLRIFNKNTPAVNLLFQTDLPTVDYFMVDSGNSTSPSKKTSANIFGVFSSTHVLPLNKTVKENDPTLPTTDQPEVSDKYPFGYGPKSQIMVDKGELFLITFEPGKPTILLNKVNLQ